VNQNAIKIENSTEITPTEVGELKEMNIDNGEATLNHTVVNSGLSHHIKVSGLSQPR
jgi:hypothetical protein